MFALIIFFQNYMQLQQNIFLFHRTVLKIPKFILILFIALVITTIGYQSFQFLTYYNPMPPQQFTKCFQQYYQKTNKHYLQYKEYQKNGTNMTNIFNTKTINNNSTETNKQQPNNQTDTTPSIKMEQVLKFINETTVLDILFVEDAINNGYGCSINFDLFDIWANQTDANAQDIDEEKFLKFSSNKQYNNSYHAGYHLIESVNLMLLPKDKQYQRKHNIQYHRIVFSESMITVPHFLMGSISNNKADTMIQYVSQSLKQVQNFIKNQIHNDSALLRIDNIWFYEHRESVSNKIIVPFNRSHSSTFINVFNKFGSLGLIFFSFYLTAMFLGIFIRYALISAMTLYSILGGKANFSWFNQYRRLILSRMHPSKNFLMFFWLAFAMFGMYMIIAFGSWWVVKLITTKMLAVVVHLKYYAQKIIKIIFFTELSYYLFMHSRVTIWYYSHLSMILGFMMIWIVSYNPFECSQYFINLYLYLQIFITLIMLLIEQHIMYSLYYSVHRPTLAKPRMLFYIGYELSWQKSIPPLWTFLSTWHDESFTSAKQMVLLDGDYQLLYGLLLGMNDRQQLPEEQQPDDASELLQMRRQLQQ